jgi:hypothetical protein
MAGVRFLAGQDFSLFLSVQTGFGPNQPPIQWVPPPHDMFRPQRAISWCLNYAKTVALYEIYKMFIYSHHV